MDAPAQSPSWLMIGGAYEIDENGGGGYRGRHVWLDGMVGFTGSMAEAKAVTAMWAEAMLVYQRTGRTF